MGTLKVRRYCPEDDRMVLAERPTPNHLLHLVLAIVTAGIWIIVWIIVSVSSDMGTFRCPHCGSPTRRTAPRGWKPPRGRPRIDDEAY